MTIVTRHAFAAPFALLAGWTVSASLLACDSPPSVPAATAEVAAPAGQGTVLLTERGLEVIRLTLPATTSTLAAFIDGLPSPEGLDPSQRSRLQRNGLAVRVADDVDLVQLVSAAGGVLAETRTWLGEPTAWRPTLRASTDGHPRLFVDGRLLAAGPGTLWFSCRGWLVKEQSEEVADVQCMIGALAPPPASLAPSTQPVLRGDDAGNLLPGTSAYFTIHRGQLAIIAPASRAASSGGRGPVDEEGPGVPTAGELLLAGRMGEELVTTVLVIVPGGLWNGNDVATAVESPDPPPPGAASP